MVKIKKDVGNLQADDDGKAYLLYTVTVTAYGGTVSGITVQDEFILGSDVISELKDITPSETVTYDKETKKMTWNVGKLEDRQQATLTYKAYIDPLSWKNADEACSSEKTIQFSRYVNNSAGVYVGDSLYSIAETKKTITKTWLNKTGQKDKSTGNVLYTLRINDNPASDAVQVIRDSLSSDSASKGAKITYPITVNVYTSSSSTKKTVATCKLEKSDLTTATDTSWSLDLTQYKNGDLQGSYYYEITYTVTTKDGDGNSLLNSVINNAGIGLSWGWGFTETTSVEVKEINSSKALTDLDYLKGYISWRSTMNTNIDAGAVYLDWIDSDKVGDQGIWWFTQEWIDAIKLYQLKTVNGVKKEVLIYSKADNINPYNITIEACNVSDGNVTNYTPIRIPYFKYSDDRTTYTTDWTKYNKNNGTVGVGYQGFKITFGSEINVEGSDGGPVYIDYSYSISLANLYHRFRQERKNNNTFGGFRYNDTWYPIKFKNNYKWTLSSGLTRSLTWVDDSVNTIKFHGDEDVLKGGLLDVKNGTITWKIYLNRQGDMSGDATVVDTLPEGLEYVKAYLDYDTSKGGTYLNSSVFDTVNYNTKYGNIKKNEDGSDCITKTSLDNGETQLTIELENLKGYSYKNADGTINADAARTGQWDQDGRVVLTIETRISDLHLLLNDKKSFTNTATVSCDTMTFGKSTVSYTVPISFADSDILTKKMNTYAGGTLLTFNITVNPEGENLVSNSDKLLVRDVMASNMSIATDRSDCFVVKDENGTAISQYEEDADGNIITNYSFEQVESDEGTAYEFTVPDGKKLTITYKVRIDASVGETVTVSNKSYFDYDGVRQASDKSSVEQKITIRTADGDAGASADHPQFSIYKTDQWGTPLRGVTFALYQVPLDASGAATMKDGVVQLGSKVDEQTTDADGYVTFNTGLSHDGVYCFYEVSAPDGYVVSTERTYFYFEYRSNTGIDGLRGIDYTEKVFNIKNTFSPASFVIPVKKTIEGKNQTNSTEFGFTLTNTTTGKTVYTDEACTVAAAKLQTTIEGSGTSSFDRLYFKEAGTYTLTMTEDALSETAAGEGFGKSDITYNITVEVEKNTDGSLSVKSADYTDGDSQTGNLLTGDKPTFDNSLTLEPIEVEFYCIKQLNGGRALPIQKDEFTFEAVEKGEVVATGTTSEDSDKDGKSLVTFKKTYGQKELGTHILTIYEVKDDTNGSITYSDTTFFVEIVVKAVGGGKLSATVSYESQNKNLIDKDTGYPIFVNQYKAEGEITLAAMKKLVYVNSTEECAVRAGEFTFTVTEGDTVVATGTTEKGGAITFDPIKYVTTDIGTHTYTITEDQGDEMFVNYTASPVEVVVDVTDDSKGKLSAKVTKVDKKDVTDGSYSILFTNEFTLKVPTGINLNVLPYAMATVMAALGALMLMRRYKRRCRRK
jgi:pilin isopeptide linkage protein